MASYRGPDREPLRYPEWPPADQALWDGLFREGGLLDDRGAAADWAVATRRKNEDGYGHWLGFLQRSSELDPDEPPADRVTAARIGSYATVLRARCKPVGVLGRVVELACVVKKMAPERSWSWLDRIIARLRTQAQLYRRHVGLPAASALYALGRRLMEHAMEEADPVGQALEYRDGLLIAMLAARPLRMRNLAIIRLGRHLLHANGHWRLAFAADETKTRRPLDLEVPDALAEPIATYLAQYRPLLLAQDGRWRSRSPGGAGDAFWVSKDGTPMLAGALADRLTKLTTLHLGVRVGPHAFRAAAATELAERDPVHVRIAAPLLGHSTFATADRHYVQASGVAAGARYAEQMRRLRRALPPADRS